MNELCFLHYLALSSVEAARVILRISSRENQHAQQSVAESVLVVPVKWQSKTVRHSVAAEQVKTLQEKGDGKSSTLHCKEIGQVHSNLFYSIQNTV